MSRTTRNSKTTKTETPVVTTGIAEIAGTEPTAVTTTGTEPVKEKHWGKDLLRLMGFKEGEKVKLLRSYTIDRYGNTTQKSLPEAFMGFMDLSQMKDLPTSITVSTVIRESIWNEAVPSGSISFTSLFDPGKGLPKKNIDWLVYFEKAPEGYSVSTENKDRARVMDLLGE